jgi:hypothetical protein
VADAIALVLYPEALAIALIVWVLLTVIGAE